ncbi:MAG: hypothetical protein MRY49_00085 [Candidatus Pacebacteria bacterium]|nr:hypothetical protein [Candidatus Paceibacterota bacterium]
MKVVDLPEGVVVKCGSCRKKMLITKKDKGKIEEVSDRFAPQFYVSCLSCKEKVEVDSGVMAIL